MKSKRPRNEVLLPLTPLSDPVAAGLAPDNPPAAPPRIPHKQILMELVQGEGAVDLVRLYRERVLTVKTRTILLLGRKTQVRIIHTLLGYEVQASYKRIACPDLVTARYLKLFSDLGCHSIKLPYDPTVTAALIPDFELAVDRIAARIHELFPSSRTTRLYVLRTIYQLIRPQLLAG